MGRINHPALADISRRLNRTSRLLCDGKILAEQVRIENDRLQERLMEIEYEIRDLRYRSGIARIE